MKRILQFVFSLFVLLSCSIDLYAQRSISGTVRDETNSPLPGANILVKGTTIGTISDYDGNFILTVPDSSTTLVISFVGYLTEEVNIRQQVKFDVVLTPDVSTLGEIVVIGYGERKKSDLIGAVSQIDSKSISELPLTSADQVLAGQAAGVQVRQTGRPGGGPEVLIRGIASIGANNAPLYVIDGYPVGNQNDQGDNFNLNWLSPEDIESISILKDASAKAIYGSRASSGVVIITTKKGKLGKPKITFSTYAGIQEIPDYEKPDVLNGQQLAQFLREMVEDDITVLQGREPTEEDIPDELRNPEQYGEGTDWFDVVTRTGVIQNYHLGISGGNEKVKYNISGGYFNQEGVLLNTNFERYSVRAKIDATINKRLRYGVSLAPSWVINNAGDTDPNANSGFGVFGSVLSAAWVDPTARPRRGDGSLTTTTLGALLPFYTANPAARQELRTDRRRTANVLFNNYIELDILNNLTAKTSFAFSLNDRKRNVFTPSILPGGSLTPNPEGSGVATAEVREETSRNWVSETTLNYENTFSKDHYINALVGFTLEDRRFENTSINARNIIEEDFILPNNGNVAQDNVNNFTGGSGNTSNTLVSLLARVDYSYANRYFVTATIRRDGSSRFGSEQRFGNFPSLGVAWRISDENFWSGLPFADVISDLKIEGAYGISGNNAIGNFDALGSVNTVDYVFGGQQAPGSVVNQVPNALLTWEETEQWDFGIDIGLLTNKLNLSVDLYNTLSRDFLTRAPVPRSTGFADIISNAGSIRNRGIEIELSTNGLVEVNKLKYDFNLNFTRNVNEVEDLINEEIGRGPAGNGTTFGITREGDPVGLYRGIQILGLYTQEQIDDPEVPKYPGAHVGSIRYLDGDGDGVLEQLEDYVIVGNPHPDFAFGIRHNFSYGNFDLSILMNGVIGQQIFDLSKQNLQNFDGVFNVRTEALERYRPGDDPTQKSVPTTVGNTSAWRIPSSNSVHDADYLLVRNITFGYNFSGDIFSNKVFERARVYVSIQNALLFTEFELGHPEVQRTGDNSLVRNVFQGSYPQPRVYTLGINVTL
ncbi:MAG: TonB-dependent receptor [Bacteroidota bacterium]